MLFCSILSIFLVSLHVPETFAKLILKGDGFTVRGHATDDIFCSKSNGVSGYIDMESDKHLFYWMLESRNDPKNDPVIFWMTGGPGASSISFGAMMEIGGCVFANDSVVHNPYGWNNNATVIFVDQPVNVGYSYSKTTVKNLYDATTDMYQFLQYFFQAFPDYSYQDFYIAGESYGGTWVPTLAQRILQRQHSSMAALVSQTSGQKTIPINLKGVMLGNALVSEDLQRPGHYDLACLGPEPLFNQSICERWANDADRCQGFGRACEQTGNDDALCSAPSGVCSDSLGWLTELLDLNPYDIRKKCTGGDLCYDFDPLHKFLNSTKTRDGFKVDDDAPFNPINQQILVDFLKVGEVFKPSIQQLTYVLNQGISALVYVGNKDWLCTAPGMRYLVDGLPWYDQASFRAEPMQPLEWKSSFQGSSAWGWYKSFGKLTYAEVDDSGHMVPLDKPKEALTLINSWIHGDLA